MGSGLKARIATAARFALRLPSLAGDVVYDFWRFARHSAAIEYRGGPREKLQAIIIRKSHNIEKGLSLPQPRPLFGQGQLRDLMRFVGEYVALHGQDEVSDIAYAVMGAYLSFHAEQGIADPFLDVLAKAAAARREAPAHAMGGVRRLDSPVPGDDHAPMLQFIRSRTSVRNFEPRPVDPDTIAQAALAAASAPSVCNRQFARVWHTSDRAMIARMLDVQGGARGFLETVPTLLMVTVDQSAYTGDERYQGWIDGGLFSMNLLLGLQAQGVASCCLNWSKTRRQDRQMRALVAIGAPETIVMLIACGYAVAETRVPISRRRSIGHFVHAIGPAN